MSVQFNACIFVFVLINLIKCCCSSMFTMWTYYTEQQPQQQLKSKSSNTLVTRQPSIDCVITTDMIVSPPQFLSILRVYFNFFFFANNCSKLEYEYIIILKRVTRRLSVMSVNENIIINDWSYDRIYFKFGYFYRPCLLVPWEKC